MDLFKTLSELCLSHGVSGEEVSAAKTAGRLLSDFSEEVSYDRLGNVLGIIKCDNPQAKTLLLDAHIDEIGLIVTGYAGGGFLRFSSIGGVDFRILPSSRVTVMGKKPILGIITSLPVHILSEEEMDKPFKADELFIDTGLDEKLVKELVSIGTRVMFDSPLKKLSDDVVCGKSIDDRGGVAVILKALDNLKNEKLGCNIAVLFSTMEEVGTRGAKTAAFLINPDCAVCIDVGHAKTPDATDMRAYEFSGGPMIGTGPLLSAEITSELIDCVAKLDIKYQLEVMEGSTGTNAGAIAFAREGVPTGLISIPLKYMHTPSEVVSLSDIESCAALLSSFILKYGQEV